MGNSQPEYVYEAYPNYDDYSQFEVYKISIPSNLVQFYYGWYEDKLERNTPFVRVIDYNPEEKGCDACSTSESLTVYTERLFFLNQLSLSYPQALFFMKECLITLDFLFDECGAFKVTPRMVGVNHKGRVKVWVNENFAENLPEEQTEYLDEEDVVYDLVDMIQEATKNYKFTRTIEKYAGSLTFENTIRVLNMMISQEGIAVNKIFLDLQEYQAEMTKAIQSRSQPAESVAQTTYYEVPQTPLYEIYEYPQQYYVQAPVSPPSVPALEYHYVQPPLQQINQVTTVAPTTLSYQDPYAQNPYSVLKLFTPPPAPALQVQHYVQPQGIHRVKKQQRGVTAEKPRNPQMNVVNRPVIERMPVTEVDMKKLEADLRKKQNEMRLKQKLQDNYNQIPQVESVIVVVEEEDRTRKHLDKISLPRSVNQHYKQPPALKQQARISQQHTPQAQLGRPMTNPKNPNSIKQVNFQSEIFNLF